MEMYEAEAAAEAAAAIKPRTPVAHKRVSKRLRGAVGSSVSGRAARKRPALRRRRRRQCAIKPPRAMGTQPEWVFLGVMGRLLRALHKL